MFLYPHSMDHRRKDRFQTVPLLLRDGSNCLIAPCIPSARTTAENPVSNSTSIVARGLFVCDRCLETCLSATIGAPYFYKRGPKDRVMASELLIFASNSEWVTAVSVPSGVKEILLLTFSFTFRYMRSELSECWASPRRGSVSM
jgi:hypothetical protein